MTACGCVSCRTPRRVCVLSARCPLCLCVPFLYPHWPLPARLLQGRDLGAPLAGHLGHTLPQPRRAQEQDRESLFAPADILGKVWPHRLMPEVALITLSGCIPPRLVILKSTPGITVRYKISPEQKTSSCPSSNPADGKSMSRDPA